MSGRVRPHVVCALPFEFAAIVEHVGVHPEERVLLASLPLEHAHAQLGHARHPANGEAEVKRLQEHEERRVTTLQIEDFTRVKPSRTR